MQNYYSVHFFVCILYLKKNYIKKERRKETIQTHVCKTQMQVRSGRENISEGGGQGELQQSHEEEMPLACLKD